MPLSVFLDRCADPTISLVATAIGVPKTLHLKLFLWATMAIHGPLFEEAIQNVPWVAISSARLDHSDLAGIPDALG
jgi:hypothetical protein